MASIMTPKQARQEMDARAAEHEAAEMRFKERNTAEKAIVAAINSLAQKYNATSDIEALNDDITIPALKNVAEKYNVSTEDMVAAISEIQVNVLQLEAVTGKLWAECWDGLKSRFERWWFESNTNN